MPGQYVRILDPQALLPNRESPREQVVDLGGFKELECDCRLLKAGTGSAGGTLKLYHAAVNEPDAFRPLTGASWVVDSSGTRGHVHVANFMRFLKWVTDANVAGSPVALLDLIAKD